MAKELSRAFKGIWISKEIWLNKSLTPFEKMLLAEIDSLDQGDGCHASSNYLADFMGSTPSSIRVIMSKLRKEGWLQDVPSENDQFRRIKVTLGCKPPLTPPLMAINTPCKPPLTLSRITENAIPSNASRIETTIQPPTEILVRDTSREDTPIVPQGGHRKRPKASDEAIGVATRFWKEYPKSKPIGEKRITRHLKETDDLLRSGASEDEIFRACQLLQGDQFRGKWVASLEQVAAHWPEICAKLNGHLRPLVKYERNKERSPEQQAWIDYDNAYRMASAFGGEMPTEPNFPRP